MFSEQDKNTLVQQFPSLKKLSYKKTYKKVSNCDLVFAIPEGINAYIWFTNFNSKDVCIVLELNKDNIISVYIKPVCFHFHLCFGTIFYGTIFKYKGYSHFSIQDLFFYKGKDTSSLKLKDKLCIYHHFFQYDINLNIYHKNFLVIGLPIICKNEDECRNIISSLPYKIRYLEFRYLSQSTGSTIYFEDLNIIKCYSDLSSNPKSFYNNYNDNLNKKHIDLISKNIDNSNKNKFIKKSNSTFSFQNKNKKREVVFMVRPDLQNDIYHLYINKGTKFHSIAYIPDYTTSVKMNKLFRIIKENENLDTLEESDDEEEFQNEKIDKYVYLDKYYNMICHYSYKFKKWIPDRIAPSYMKIIEEDQLICIEKNK